MMITRSDFYKNDKCFGQKLLRNKTHFLCTVAFFNTVFLWDNLEKHGTARQATVKITAQEHAHCILDT